MWGTLKLEAVVGENFNYEKPKEHNAPSLAKCILYLILRGMNVFKVAFPALYLAHSR